MYCGFVYIGEIGFILFERGDMVNNFENLLLSNLKSLERFVYYKVSNKEDAQDIIQETCLTASLKFESLRDQSLFKAWLIRIANNKCNDYFRKKAKYETVSFDLLADFDLAENYTDNNLQLAVKETFEQLEETDRQILCLFYLKNLSQKEISQILKIPVGTVKSRLYYAKEKFKAMYPYQPKTRGDEVMKKLPELLPDYKIEQSDKAPFSVKCEELPGWTIVPKLNEEVAVGLYYMPSRKLNGYFDAKVIGEAEIYGIRGVEILAVEHEMENYYRTDRVKENQRNFIAQLTDTHSRFLAETHFDNGIRKVHTFIDDDEFTENWGYGEDNCGNEILIEHKNLITRNGNVIKGNIKPEVVDIVGRYNVTINNKTYDTVCVMDLNCFNDPVVSEQYIDQNGRTVLWRRFNRNDWAFERYGKTWTEMLPENEKLTVNGETYVHWYDCISTYIL